LESAFLPICNDSGANLSATLQRSEHNSFVFSACTSDAALPLVNVHVSRLTADEGFVNFDFTVQLAPEEFILQSQANPMQHEPSGFLSDAQITRNLATADSVLAVGKQPHCREPLVQTERRILADSSDLDGELASRMMARTLPSAASAIEGADILRPTSRANDNPIRPAADGQILNANVGVREVLDGFLQALWFGHNRLVHCLNSSSKQWASQVNNCPILLTF
jgi:hypothetical protein